MIQNPGSSLLYPSASGLERAISDVEATRLLDIYAEAIIDTWDPFKIRLDLLPYLAFAMGVNYWDDDWSETTKRNWVARQWEFKSKRGTLAGAEMALDFAGRDVSPRGYALIKATVPPQKVFSGPSLTVDEREAWLETMPQLRVWRVQETGYASIKKAFYGGNSSRKKHDRRFFFGSAANPHEVNEFPITTDAITRLHRRARWVVNDVETDITVTEFGSYWQVHFPGVGKDKVFSNTPSAPGHFYIPSDASTRLFTVAPQAALPWRSRLTPTLAPVTAEPELITVPGIRGFSVFCDTCLSPKAFYVPSTSWKRIFERYAIPLGAGALKRRAPVQFMGVGRYGFPKYTAWLQVALSGKRSPFAAGEGLMLPRSRFWVPHDPKPMLRARAALAASKRLADRVMIDTGPVSPFIAGGTPILAGDDHIIVN